MAFSFREGYPTGLMGGSLLWGWSFLYFFFSQPGSYRSEYALQGDFLYLGSVLVTSLAIVACSARVKGLSEHFWIAYVGCGSIVVGTLLTAALPALADIGVPFWVALLGKLMAGVGQGAFWIVWGEAVAECEVEQAETALLGWLPAIAAIFFVVAVAKGVFGMPDFVLMLLSAALPVLSLASLRILFRKGHVGCAETPCETAQEGKAFSVEPFVKGLCNIGCVFAVISFVWNSFLQSESVDLRGQLIVFMIGSVCSFAIMSKVIDTTNRFDLMALYRWSLPALTLGIALEQMPDAGLMPAVFLCLASINIGFEVMSKLYFVHVAQKSGTHKLEVIGLGFSTGTVGGMVGTFAWDAVSRIDDPATHLAAVLVALFLFSAIVSLTTERRAAASPMKDSAGLSADGCQNEEVKPESDVLERCRSVAGRFGLSDREFDVLYLLAQGWSRTHIRETLFISKGTVDTHVHHIYAKLGVTSKDSLMALVIDEGRK